MSSQQKIDYEQIAETFLFAASLAGIHFAVYIWCFTERFWEVVDVTAASTYFATLGFYFLICFSLVQYLVARIAHWSFEFTITDAAFLHKKVRTRSHRILFGIFNSAGKITGVPFIGYTVSSVVFSYLYCTLSFFFILTTSFLVFTIWAFVKLPDSGMDDKVESFSFKNFVVGKKGQLLIRAFGITTAILLAMGHASSLKDQISFLKYETATGQVIGRTILWTEKGQLIYTDKKSIVFVPDTQLEKMSEIR
jgi:hypothetical protein